MKSMLTFSKASDYKMVKIDLGHLISRLLEQFQTVAMRSGITIKFQKDDNLPPVRGNYRALEQVFTNLFENSIHAMNETGGQLAIKATQKIEAAGRDFVHISVADTGPGIPEDEQKVIFQPFYSTKADGTGLGLAISKRIITAHKGSIQLDSFPGCSIFYLELPVFSD
jgi:signal transduction histidine kinase